MGMIVRRSADVGTDVLAQVDYQTYTGNTSTPYHLRDASGVSEGLCAIEVSQIGRGPGPKGVDQNIWDWEHVATGGYNNRIQKDQSTNNASEGLAVCPCQIGVWENLQFSAKFGNNPVLKIWWRDHTYASPFRQSVITTGLWDIPWTPSMRFGDYLSDSVLNDISWDIDSFVFSTQFDSNWG